MFTLFTHKGLRELAPFEITKTLKDYIRITRPEIIIVSPGYLSISSNTTKQFLDDLLYSWYRQSQYKVMGITAGMNGVNGYGIPVNLSNHWSELIANKLSVLKFQKNNGYQKFATNRDHKKMVFIGKIINDDIEICSEINIDNLDTFINNIKITAVSTGSSNFSKTTYLGNNKNNRSDKGESDVFMYTKSDNAFHSFIFDDVQRFYDREIVPPILSESILIGSIPPNANNIINSNLSDDEKYLTWMLYETLKDQLI